ncbi:hypothetical protein MBLNU457_g0886t1 [Dothideomycetes sp. NU457]
MLAFIFYSSLTFAVTFAATATSSTSGYVGYNLTLEGDQGSVIYSTDNTRANASAAYPDPDVYLNASVSVDEIDIEVDNLSAKINLDLEILQLLQFNAGVDLSVDNVNLLIQDVKAKVLLEARLENLVNMVDDVLSSLDLNPILATLGDGVSSIVNETANAAGGLLNSATNSSSTAKRSFDIEDNILYSVNDFSGNSHMNHILKQNGNIVEQDLDNDGYVSRTRIIGSYAQNMTFTGHEVVVDEDGKKFREKQYKYEPIHGVHIVTGIVFNGAGNVVGSRILSEVEIGGFATIAGDGQA